MPKQLAEPERRLRLLIRRVTKLTATLRRIRQQIDGHPPALGRRLDRIVDGYASAVQEATEPPL